MPTVSTRFSTVARTATSAAPKTDSPPHALSEYLSKLYALSQRSNYVFASPIGPFYHRARHLSLPRFVYFGPHTHDESLRLAFLSGFNHQDLRGSLALLQFIEQLVLKPDLGHGLNLSLFPLLDVVGLYHGVKNRHLGDEDWFRPKTPEIELLGKDARTRGYHGFVNIETVPGGDEITVSLRSTDEASGVELISSEDFDPLPVRWEANAFNAAPTSGRFALPAFRTYSARTSRMANRSSSHGGEFGFETFHSSLPCPPSLWPRDLVMRSIIQICYKNSPGQAPDRRPTARVRRELTC
jgi:hypothetical protein